MTPGIDSQSAIFINTFICKFLSVYVNAKLFVYFILENGIPLSDGGDMPLSAQPLFVHTLLEAETKGFFSSPTVS